LRLCLRARFAVHRLRGYRPAQEGVLAKIAAVLQQALEERAVTGAAGALASRTLACGDAWTVEDVVCTSGPDDRKFEERHGCVRVVIVCAGSFQYRSAGGRELMTPGSLLLGNDGQGFECGHEHGVGDRCLSFGYRPDYFEQLAAEAGLRGRAARFAPLRLPPLRELSGLVSRACGALVRSSSGLADDAWDELSMLLAMQAARLANGRPRVSWPSGAEARVTRAVRLIDRDPSATLGLEDLARQARLSPWHFLRTFERLTGLTPHQYVRRARLRDAAVRLAVGSATVLDISGECGFGDISNFNRAFRAEFGCTPGAYRAAGIQR
jgi:AraC family transcriptional regulator